MSSQQFGCTGKPYQVTATMMLHTHTRCLPFRFNFIVRALAPASALTLPIGWQEGHPACKKLGGFLTATFCLELCMSYSASCHHHLRHPTCNTVGWAWGVLPSPDRMGNGRFRDPALGIEQTKILYKFYSQFHHATSHSPTSSNVDWRQDANSSHRLNYHDRLAPRVCMYRCIYIYMQYAAISANQQLV